MSKCNSRSGEAPLYSENLYSVVRIIPGSPRRQTSRTPLTSTPIAAPRLLEPEISIWTLKGRMKIKWKDVTRWVNCDPKKHPI